MLQPQYLNVSLAMGYGECVGYRVYRYALIVFFVSRSCRPDVLCVSKQQACAAAARCIARWEGGGKTIMNHDLSLTQ